MALLARTSRPFSLLFVVTFVALFAVGCGGGDGEGDTGGGGGGGGGGGSLSISGTPPTQILAGTQFSFTPMVNNPSGGALSFTATNLPSWVMLNSTTGLISGMPDNGDVGTYSGISLTVTSGSESVTTPAYTIEVVATATGSATLTWTPPTMRTDGTPLGNDLAGYRIYWGLSAGNLNNSDTVGAGITTYFVDQLTPGTWYFAATAFDKDGLESVFSNTAQKTISP